MKNLKRFLCAALVAVLALTMLTGCAQSESQKEDALYNTLSALMKEYNVDITRDEELTRQARAFASLVESGTYLESNKKAGIAYAYVDSSKAHLGNCLMTSCNWVSTPTVNVALKIPYTADTMLLASLLNNGGDQESVRLDIERNNYQKVGVAIATIKGDDYCLIFVGN